MKNKLFFRRQLAGLFLAIIFFLSPAWGFSSLFALECESLPKGRSEKEYSDMIAVCEEARDKAQKDLGDLQKAIETMTLQEKTTRIKINQAETQIAVLEDEIAGLSAKIGRLNESLDYVSKVFISRINLTYKMGLVNPMTMLFGSKNLSEFLAKSKYLRIIQLNDRKLLLSMEETKVNYDEQKQTKEQLQAKLVVLKKQLDLQKANLSSQIASRKKLLEETKGKQAIYEKLIAEARAELVAITGILSGEGNEKKIRNVSEGERIASVISGASCNSSGTHLHFMVVKGDGTGNTENPFSFLRGGIDYLNCSGSACGSGDGDAFNPGGGWNWPMNPKIILNQGYGNTWATQHTWVGKIYKFHNGIDVEGANTEVKAVKAGELYWGSFVGRCTLQYVRVKHNEDNLNTYYLHVNY